MMFCPQMKASRNTAEVEASLARLEEAAGGDGNLLEAAVVAARARATVGEISSSMEKVSCCFCEFIYQSVTSVAI